MAALFLLLGCASCAAPAPRVVYAYVPAPRVDQAALQRLFQQEMVAREQTQALVQARSPERCRALLEAVPEDVGYWLTTQEQKCASRAAREIQ